MRRFIFRTIGRPSLRNGVGFIAGLTAIAALSILLLLTHGASVAEAVATLNCTATNPGVGGVLDVSVSGTPAPTDYLTIVANAGEFSLSFTSNGSPAPVCTTFSDIAALGGYPTVEVTGSTLTTVFQSGSDNSLTFNGQAGAGDVLDLSSLTSTSPVKVSVSLGTVTWNPGNHDSFSGIASFVGSSAGRITFVASATGGYAFAASGPNNVLDLSGAGAGLTVSVPSGTVGGFTSGGNDTFSGIASVVGSSLGSTTVIPGASALNFQGLGAGNELDLSSVATSPSAPLSLNESGGSVNGQPNDSVAAGGVTYSFSGISDFAGPTSGNATFFAGPTGGFDFYAAGLNNTLDLSAALSGALVSETDGTVSALTSGGDDTFSGITTFNGSRSGATTFIAGSTDGVNFNASGNGNTFVAGSGSDGFNANGAANALDFPSVGTSLGTPLRVNFSGITVGSLLNDTAAVGATTYTFSGITDFDGASSGFTTFFASSTGGDVFNFSGAGDRLDLSFTSAPSMVVSVPNSTLTLGAVQDTFSGGATFVGPSVGNSTFVAGTYGGYGFTSSGSNNILDLSAAPSGTSVSVPNGTVSGLTFGGSDTFSGITSFVGSSLGDTTLAPGASNVLFEGLGSGNELDLSAAVSAPAAPLSVNVSGGPLTVASSLVDQNTAAVGGVTYSFSGVTSFAGPTSGNATFFAGPTGGYGFNAAGSNNTLDLSAAPTNTTVSVPGGTVSGFTVGGNDTFSGIATFDGAVSGATTFTAGSANGETFNASGNANTFVAGSGSDVFNATGVANALDFSAVSTSSGTGLLVNLSGTPDAIASDSAAVGASTYVFSGITTFTGATSGYTTFAVGATDVEGFHFAGPSDSLDLSLLSTSSSVTVSVPTGTLTIGSLEDSFTGVANFIGAPSGSTTFDAGSAGGYGFTGSGSNNILDLSAAPTNTTVSVPAGTVSGFSAGGNDTFSGITSFVGSSLGDTTLAPGASNVFFKGQGTGNELDLSSLASAPAAPLWVNVSGGPRTVSSSLVDNNTAVLGPTTYSFSGVTSFAGPTSGNATFFAGPTGGYGFNAAGSNNTLDLSAAPTNTTVSVPGGTVSGFTVGGNDTFSGIATFDGAVSGATTFTAGSANGETFNASGNANTFVAGSGSDVFNATGVANALDFSAVSTSSGTPLHVNVSGIMIGSLLNETAVAGSSTYVFSGITTFTGATTGFTTFFASGGGGDRFHFAGSHDNLDLSFSTSPSMVVSVPTGTLTWGSAQDTFSGVANFVSPPSGNTTFVAGSAGGYGFTASGSNNILDLSEAGAGLSVSVPASTVSGFSAGGSDTFSGVASFVGSTAGMTTLAPGPSAISFQGHGTGNELDLSSLASSASVPLSLNVSGTTFNGQPSNTAAVGGVTYSFSGVSSFTGASDGFTTFFAGPTGGYGFNAAGSNNTLDLSAAPAGTTAIVNGDTLSNPGIVTGLTSGTDSFSGIQHITGLVTIAAPTVIGVSSTLANGFYGVGTVVPVTVAFGEPVTVTGTPRLALNSGGVASYASGSGTSTLTFQYTVAAGQDANPLDYASIGALHLNGGTIEDAASNAAKLTLSTPGAAGSLSANRSIVIDTTAPTITITTPTDGSTYLLGQVVTAEYGCADRGGAGVLSCVGTVTNGSAIVTAMVGANSFTVIATDRAGNTRSRTFHYTVIYGFGGFLSPLPASRLLSSSSSISVTFTLTNSLGQAIPASSSAQLAANNGIEVILTGPNSNAQQPVLCSWSATSLYFRCTIKTPAKVRAGATYFITAEENVSGTFKAAPSYSSKPFDFNPEPVTFR